MPLMFRWPFRSRKIPTDLDAFVAEKWEARFSHPSEARFTREAGSGFSVDLGRTSRMELVRPRLFAWTVDPWYRYRDLVLEADFTFGAANGGSAVGLVLRYTNDENYAYVLVSNTGRIRFDVVFNGTPIPLIPWTSLAQPPGASFNLTAIVHGQHFSFYVDKNWVAEVADDHLDSGRVGWAGQNYGDRSLAEFTLSRFCLESRPVEVEAQYLRWTRLILSDPAQRRVLAQSFFGFGRFIEAEIQMRRVLLDHPATRDDLFFLAQCVLRQDRTAEALKLIEEILLKEPGWELALKEKANIFYLQNRYSELKDALGPLLKRFPEDDMLWNLQGHAQTGLGNWSGALESYQAAWKENPRMPVYALNAGLTFERLKRPDDAARYYIDAGTEWFRQEAWSEVDDILARLEFIACDQSLAAQTLRAKALFQKGEVHRARPLLEEALRQGSKDSAVAYLLAVASRQEGRLEEALRLAALAATWEPDFYLFHFKLAEWLKEAGRDFDEELQKALALAPQDPWVLNLRGLTASSNNEKTFYLEKAHLALPQEPAIAINLSEHYHSLGRRDEAFRILEGWENRADIANHRGNLLIRERQYERAADEYEKALAREPKNLDYLQNAASCALELERYIRAEELLLTILELAPTAQAYVALGNLMRVEGDFVRSEVALRTALEKEPDNFSALMELGWLYLSRQKFSLVQGILTPVIQRQLDESQQQAVQELQAAYRRLAGEWLSCSTCGREWWVPLQLPLQSWLKVRGEIPDEAPAGASEATGKIFCVGCAQKHMKEGRFLCPDSGQPLILKDDRLKFLLRQALEKLQP